MTCFLPIGRRGVNRDGAGHVHGRAGADGGRRPARLFGMSDRWRDLFADLDARFEAEAGAEQGAEVADRTRREQARLDLLARLAPALGCRLRVAALGAGSDVISGVLAAAGPDWLLVDTDRGEVLLPAHAIGWLEGLPPRAAEPETRGAVTERLGLGYVLRGLARDRSPLQVRLTDGSALVGTIDRVYRDTLDLAVHPAGEVRRRATVQAVRTLPLTGLAWLARRPG